MTDIFSTTTTESASAPAVLEQAEPAIGYEEFRKHFQTLIQSDPILQQALQQNAQNTVELQKQRLKEAWGAEYETTFVEVEQELQNIAKTNPTKAQALADADGAILLAQALKARKASQAPAEFGGLNRSTAPAYQAEAPLFTQSQISKMTPSERRANHSAITAAYARGLVDRNS